MDILYKDLLIHHQKLYPVLKYSGQRTAEHSKWFGVRPRLDLQSSYLVIALTHGPIDTDGGPERW